MKNKKKLKGKDLINIGIYAAIYCVIMTAVAMLGFIPIMMPLLCVIVPIFGGNSTEEIRKAWTGLFYWRRPILSRIFTTLAANGWLTRCLQTFWLNRNISENVSVKTEDGVRKFMTSAMMPSVFFRKHQVTRRWRTGQLSGCSHGKQDFKLQALTVTLAVR